MVIMIILTVLVILVLVGGLLFFWRRQFLAWLRSQPSVTPPPAPAGTTTTTTTQVTSWRFSTASLSWLWRWPWAVIKWLWKTLGFWLKFAIIVGVVLFIVDRASKMPPYVIRQGPAVGSPSPPVRKLVVAPASFHQQATAHATPSGVVIQRPAVPDLGHERQETIYRVAFNPREKVKLTDISLGLLPPKTIVRINSLSKDRDADRIAIRFRHNGPPHYLYLSGRGGFRYETEPDDHEILIEAAGFYNQAIALIEISIKPPNAGTDSWVHTQQIVDPQSNPQALEPLQVARWVDLHPKWLTETTEGSGVPLITHLRVELRQTSSPTSPLFPLETIQEWTKAGTPAELAVVSFISDRGVVKPIVHYKQRFTSPVMEINSTELPPGTYTLYVRLPTTALVRVAVHQEGQ